MNARPKSSLFRELGKLFFRASTIEAGGSGRRWGGRGIQQPASEIQRRRQAAEWRATDAAFNSPYGRAAVEALVSNLVADGPSIRPSTRQPEIKDKLLSTWSRFWWNCDSEGRLALDGMLQAAVRSIVIAGECFVHLSIDGDTGSLRLQLLSPSQIDPTFDRKLADGGEIKGGIEYDGRGRARAYYVRDTLETAVATGTSARRVPAQDMIHAYDVLLPGQRRGLSWLAAGLTRDTEINKLEDALLAKFNVAALTSLIIKKPDGGSTSVLPRDENGHINLAPGAVVEIPPGYDAQGFDGGSSDGSVEFLRSQIRSMAAGVGVPYELISGDLSQVNYSSARLGLMEFRGRISALQKSLVVARILRPIWKRLLLVEGLAGRMPMEAATGTEVEFIFRGWAPIDPLKETNADISAIKAGIKSRFEVIAARGRDPEEVDLEIATDAAFAPAKENASA